MKLFAGLALLGVVFAGKVVNSANVNEQADD
jgi:hypothetical protein